MLDSLSLQVVEFLCTYFVHSLVLLSGAWCLKKFGMLRRPVVAEFVWRFALFGALVSTCILVLIYPSMQSSLSKMYATKLQNQIRAEHAQIKPLSNPEFATAISQAQLRSRQTIQPRKVDISTEQQKGAVKAPSADTIFVPIQFKSILTVLALAWLGYCVLSVIQYFVQIWKLNQVVNQMEDCPPRHFRNFLNKNFPLLANQLNIRKTQNWNSPIVAPNHTICLPEWVLQELTPKQIEVMLAHEVAHIQRNDPTWTILYQLVNRLFFFQALNLVAIRELNALAELACDHAAGKSEPDRKLLAEALFACAQVQADHVVPNFALAMAKARSPLVQRVNVLLDNNTALSRMTQYQANWSLFLIGGITSMFAVMYLLPQAKMNFESIKTVVTSIKNETLKSMNQSPATQVTTPLSSATTVSNLENANTPENIGSNVDAQRTRQLQEPTPTLEQNNPTFAAENQSETSVEKWNIEDAKQAHSAKRYQQAFEIVRPLASAGDIKAQSMLAEMYWFGEGMTPNLDEAEKWFRSAATAGDNKAQEFVNLINERKQRKVEIAFFIGDAQASSFRYLADKCPFPEYSQSLFASNTSKLEAWYKCEKKYYDALKTAKELDQIIVPSSLLRIMTDSEMKKAETNSAKVIEQALENVKQHHNEMQAELQAWMDAHPNLITNSYRPIPKLPEAQTRQTEPRAISFPLLIKQPPP